MINVIVLAFGNLRQYLPGKSEKADMMVPDSTTISSLIEDLCIPPGEFWFAAVNGSKVNDDHRLSDGEEVTLFSPVSGG
ncbi:MAG: MoaD/ThiS family protein [bacterium]|jgi:molybdopterin converting factor small subunit